MRLNDMIVLGVMNLWRTKLRTSLTILGVMIGIGALTSMISFGTGMEKNITDSFRNNDMFTSLYVVARSINLKDISEGDVSEMLDSSRGHSIPLNDSAINIIRGIKGVEIAYPEISFPVRARLIGKENDLKVSGIPYFMKKFQPFNEITWGKFFAGDSSATVVISWNALREMKILVNDPENPVTLDEKDKEQGVLLVHPDSIIGRPLYLTTAVMDFQSLYLRSMGLRGNKGNIPVKEITTPFIISGIIKSKSPFGVWNFRGDIFMPYRTSLMVPRLPVNNIMDMLGNDNNPDTYNSIYVRTAGPGELDAVIVKLKELNFNVLALTDQLKEIRLNFLIMDGILGAIGTIALIVAGLGIMNTMVMSILERTREIGIMKAIGGSEPQIRMIFFAEAGVIGFVGALLGLVLGWLVTIIANKIANLQLLPLGEAPVNFFYFPLWLVLGAIIFSVILSLAAGLYPAIRASRVDPVKALRHD